MSNCMVVLRMTCCHHAFLNGSSERADSVSVPTPRSCLTAWLQLLTYYTVLQGNQLLPPCSLDLQLCRSRSSQLATVSDSYFMSYDAAVQAVDAIMHSSLATAVNLSHPNTAHGYTYVVTALGITGSYLLPPCGLHLQLCRRSSCQLVSIPQRSSLRNGHRLLVSAIGRAVDLVEVWQVGVVFIGSLECPKDLKCRAYTSQAND